MRTFDYVRPATLPEALAALAASPEARALGGGMSLVPALKLRLASPSALVDLRGIPELRGIRITDDAIVIGATTTHADVATHPAILERLPALAALAGGIGDPQVRNCGTIGGVVANNDPSADYPAALLALGATIETSRGSHAADDFFSGMFETALAPGEIVTAIRFPIPKQAAYEKFKSPASRYALVGVFVAVTSGGVRVAVTGAASCVFRADMIESALGERLAPESLEGLRFSTDGLNADMHADAPFRAHLIGVLARRAVSKLLATGKVN